MDCRGSWSLLLLLSLLSQHFGLRQGIRVFEFSIGSCPEGWVHTIEQSRIAGD